MVRIGPAITGLADQYMRLGGIEGNALFKRLAQRRDFRHGWQRRLAITGRCRQARQQAGGNRIGLRTRDRTNHTDARTARHHASGMHTSHIGHADLRQRCFRHFMPIRMRAVHRGTVGPANNAARARIGLPDGGLHALAIALPDGVGK